MYLLRTATLLTYFALVTIDTGTVLFDKTFFLSWLRKYSMAIRFSSLHVVHAISCFECLSGGSSQRDLNCERDPSSYRSQVSVLR